MKKFYLFVFASIVMLFSACHDKIWDAIDDLDARVAKLEELCREMNTNISSLQTIVSALQENDFITGIVPIEKDGEVVGYTIMFGKHDPITIYNGEDGKDGYAPILGVAKDADGVYYWTIDGNWLLDAEGNKICVTGNDGKDGQPGENGITPKLKIENNYWYISYDNGVTWTELGKAIGEKGEDGQPGVNGDSMFLNVTYDEKYVYFTLTNGTTLVVPRVDASDDFDQTVIDNLVNSLELDKDTIYLIVGDVDTIVATTAPFPTSKVTWTSNDSTIAKVENGIVSAISVGNAIISAKAGTLEKECCVYTIKAKEYVDLGLSVKWATCNVGANLPEEYGVYFAWGETKPKTIYDWSTYTYANGASTFFTKYCSQSKYGKDGFTDDKTVLDPEDDAATANWGGAWRMPTYEEMIELKEQCIWTWITQNGVVGYNIEGKNGNSIFLPASGYMANSSLSNVGKQGDYCSSSLYIDNPQSAYSIFFDSTPTNMGFARIRAIGHSVRPVCP